MRVLAGKATDEQQRQLLLNARDVASELLLDIRNMAVELRPTALDDLGLAAAMRKYVADFQERFGITVQFSADSDMPMLDSDLSVTLYRIMQESLTNAARHSGASSVEIRLLASEISHISSSVSMVYFSQPSAPCNVADESALPMDDEMPSSQATSRPASTKVGA